MQANPIAKGVASLVQPEKLKLKPNCQNCKGKKYYLGEQPPPLPVPQFQIGSTVSLKHFHSCQLLLALGKGSAKQVEVRQRNPEQHTIHTTKPFLKYFYVFSLEGSLPSLKPAQFTLFQFLLQPFPFSCPAVSTQSWNMGLSHHFLECIKTGPTQLLCSATSQLNKVDDNR